MFSQAFVGISRRSGVRARQSSVWRSRSSVVGLAFALVVAGTFGPEPLYAQDVTPPDQRRTCRCRQALSAYLRALRGPTPWSPLVRRPGMSP